MLCVFTSTATDSEHAQSVPKAQSSRRIPDASATQGGKRQACPEAVMHRGPYTSQQQPFYMLLQYSTGNFTAHFSSQHAIFYITAYFVWQGNNPIKDWLYIICSLQGSCTDWRPLEAVRKTTMETRAMEPEPVQTVAMVTPPPPPKHTHIFWLMNLKIILLLMSYTDYTFRNWSWIRIHIQCIVVGRYDWTLKKQSWERF